jgi:uncharacterized protein YhjY with autotransporter beta-barrel domain
MKTAQIKIRIRHVKLDGLAFDRQCDAMREALKIDRRYIATMEFARWAKANRWSLSRMAAHYERLSADRRHVVGFARMVA